MTEIIPTILVYDEQTFEAHVTNRIMRTQAPLWQMDILDGTLFGETCWADPVHAAHYDLPLLELHLMTEYPVTTLKSWLTFTRRIKRAFVHAEISTPVEQALKEISALGVEPGLALNPETAIEDVEHVIPFCKRLLLMSYPAGKSGRTFMKDMILHKIETAKRLFPNVPVAIDGGVNLETAPLLINAGADALCSGSTLWSAKDVKETIADLRRTL